MHLKYKLKILADRCQSSNYTVYRS